GTAAFPGTTASRLRRRITLSLSPRAHILHAPIRLRKTARSLYEARMTICFRLDDDHTTMTFGTLNFEHFQSVRRDSITLFLCRWRNNWRRPIWVGGLITSTQTENTEKEKRR